jgi:hypothetical protein
MNLFISILKHLLAYERKEKLFKGSIYMHNVFSWHNLRTYKESQSAAFEELCCQLAAHEPVPEGSLFRRKGVPDAGVECYWELVNQEMWAWQAKFFTFVPGDSQWTQMDNSVTTALIKHPTMVRYTVCLPLDRADPRLDNQKWFMDKWQDHVEKWKKQAHDLGMHTEFEYWGQHEIVERLSRDEHKGRYYFWFNREFFSTTWFDQRIKSAIANVGPRYTPELNVKLPIARLFDALGRTKEFYTQIKQLCPPIQNEFDRVLSSGSRNPAIDDLSSIQTSVTSLIQYLAEIDQGLMNIINWTEIYRRYQEIQQAIMKAEEKLASPTQQISKGESVQTKNKVRSPEDNRNLLYHLRKLEWGVGEVDEWCQNKESTLSNTPALLVSAEAGMGKTHLFCDVVQHRIRSGLPTVLLLGEHFNISEPWSQIIQQLGLNCSKEEFLGALEASAQTVGSRAIIFIDALNEGEGKRLWSHYLAGVLKDLVPYPWIGIAVSVRSSYEHIVIPERLHNELTSVIHHGFAEHEFDAMHSFFEYYRLESPSVPLLLPEFQNPLFLKLLCQSLKVRGQTQVPRGLMGFTSVFKFFLNAINEKLARPDSLDLDPKARFVQNAARVLAEKMAERGQTYLDRAEAVETINSLLPRQEYEKSLFRAMVSEGIITESNIYHDLDNWREIIHFSYERFGDHLIADVLLTKHLNTTNLDTVFQPGQPLYQFVKEKNDIWINQGLIEALCIQLPERFGKEFIKFVPHCRKWGGFRHAFIESLVWRHPNTFSADTMTYLNEDILRDGDSFDQFWQAILTVATVPSHPLNAKFLHNHLMSFTMPDRDAWWSIFLHKQHGGRGGVDRLVKWAWSPSQKRHIDDEAIHLCSIALSWFLTTPNRFLRDKSTKALVTLLTPRFHILQQLLKEFQSVNDLYILERLYAVAYGCAMRASQSPSLDGLALDVYELIFKNGTPIPHITLRDYARGVIELALCRNPNLPVDVVKIRPPYHSEWLKDIPTMEEVKKYGEYREGMPQEEFSRTAIYSSIMEYGDFGRYIIGTNFGSSEWLSRKINESRSLSAWEKIQAFIASLTPRQQQKWKELEETRNYLKIISQIQTCLKENSQESELPENEDQQKVEAANRAFRRTLGKAKAKIYEEVVIPYQSNPLRPRSEDGFDLSLVQRWVLKRVFELGWTVERFGKFDREVNAYHDYGRSEKKPERIGKKYQWLAYREFLARLSDNFALRDEVDSTLCRNYDGLWQISRGRDIDPSVLIEETKMETWLEHHTNTWWFPVTYDGWNQEADFQKWEEKIDDVPDVQKLIEIIKPEEHRNWLLLEGSYNWDEPVPPAKDPYQTPRRQLWVHIRSYFVHQEHVLELYKWAQEQNFGGEWMPESRSLLYVFLGEYFWSPAYLYHSIPYYSNPEWTEDRLDRLPHPVMITTEQYSWETSYDCSINKSIFIHLPCKWLADGMMLQWNGTEGQFVDTQGDLILHDPSVSTKGPGVLLIQREPFVTFLKKNKLCVLWTVYGEKQCHGNEHRIGLNPGRLVVNGAYMLNEGIVKGQCNAEWLR